MIIHSAKETRQQKEQRTGELEKTLKRVGMQYRGSGGGGGGGEGGGGGGGGGLNKIGG